MLGVYLKVSIFRGRPEEPKAEGTLVLGGKTLFQDPLSSNYQSRIAYPQPANGQDTRLALGNRRTEDCITVIALQNIFFAA